MHAADVWKVGIITMSFGWPQYHPCVEQAINHASSKPVILCAAASNDGANVPVVFPASYSPVFCVHSATGWGRHSAFTPLPLDNSPNFAVLGEAVNSTWPTQRGEGSEKSKWGTSTATPILAAIIALILEFINLKPKKTSHDKRIQSPAGMTQVLQAMSQIVQGYSVVTPWKILDLSKGRTRVEELISNRMDEAFGKVSVQQSATS